MSFERQIDLPVTYEKVKMDIGFRADLVIERKVIIELKSVEKILPVHQKQLLTYFEIDRIKTWTVSQFLLHNQRRNHQNRQQFINT